MIRALKILFLGTLKLLQHYDTLQLNSYKNDVNTRGDRKLLSFVLNSLVVSAFWDRFTYQMKARYFPDRLISMMLDHIVTVRFYTAHPYHLLFFLPLRNVHL